MKNANKPTSVTFRFPDFCQFIEGLGFGKFGLGKRVWVSVLENIVLEKVSALVSEYLVTKKINRMARKRQKQKQRQSDNQALPLQ